MKMISLNKGLFALVDDEDYEYLTQWKWYAQKDNRVFYVSRYVRVHSDKRKYKYIRRGMQNELMNPPKDYIVDHKDHNGLNNQKHNLRCCLNKQNVRNMRIPIDNSTGFKGVCSRKQREHKELKYSAYIQRIHLGHFKTKEEAALAYNKKAKELFGEFACLNQVLRKNK